MSVPEHVKAFGAEVRRRRESLGWNLFELAERTGLTPNYLGSIELGNRDPSLSTMKKIARGFDLTLAELLGPGEISPAAYEAALLLAKAPHDVQEAIERILACFVRKPRR